MIELTCLICKNKFPKYKNGHANKLYCSRNCSGKAKTLLASVTKKCLNCNKIFTRIKSEIKHQSGCCTVRCGLDYYFKDHKGENHPHWKGNRVSNKIIRMRFHREIRDEVLKRDNYTCQLCGETENLHVDHFQKWEEYVNLRFSIDNCRTVCMKCHYQITFGKPMPKRVKKWGWISKTNKEVVCS